MRISWGTEKYNVVVNNNRFCAFMLILKLSTVVDDFLYANVDDITLNMEII